jgi:hypothetical protein
MKACPDLEDRMDERDFCVWRIYYANGSAFSSDDGAPSEVPLRGVQIIVQTESEVGRSFWNDCDYYWWEQEHNQWLGGDLAGLLDYLGRCSLATVLQGRTVSDSVYRRIKQRALEDPDFPRKSAKYPRERLDG